VRRGSSYYGTLATLNQQLTAAEKPPIVIQIAPDDEETDSLLEKVSRGEILYTMADDLLANLHTAYWPALVIGPAISAERQLAWAVRPGDVKLRQAIDDVFSELRKKPDFNLLKRKYFEAKRSLQQERKDQFYASDTGALSSYDPLFRKYAGSTGSTGVWSPHRSTRRATSTRSGRAGPERSPLPDHARHGEGAGHRGPVGCRAVDPGRAQVHGPAQEALQGRRRSHRAPSLRAGRLQHRLRARGRCQAPAQRDGKSTWCGARLRPTC